jgi:hypothetical protein
MKTTGKDRVAVTLTDAEPGAPPPITKRIEETERSRDNNNIGWIDQIIN